MESHLSPGFKKWMKKCLSDEFSNAIENHLSRELEPYDVAQKVINSPQMTELGHALRASFIEQIEGSKKLSSSQGNSAGVTAECNQTTIVAVAAPESSWPQTSLSFVSDLSCDDWSLLRQDYGSGGGDSVGEIRQIVDRMSSERPDHVRLSGYEALLENPELLLAAQSSSSGGGGSGDCWPALLKTLRDGIVEGGRSVFEASLRAHAKLMTNWVRFGETYANLLSCFERLSQAARPFEALPSQLSGLNFKIFLHEKLLRVLRLAIDQQEELIKTTRPSDNRASEEAIERFVDRLGGGQTQAGSSSRSQLSPLQLLAVLEPRAAWSRRWMHSSLTRKMLCGAIGKSASFLPALLSQAKRGLEQPPRGVSVLLNDECLPAEAFVSGDSVETLAFLHSLGLLVQLCRHSIGRELLRDNLDEASFAGPADLALSLLACLNKLASSAASDSNGIYEALRSDLSQLLGGSAVPPLYDARLYPATLRPLVAPPRADPTRRLWPHSLDVLRRMLDATDGPSFLVSDRRDASARNDRSDDCSAPVVAILAYASNVLRQPLALLAIEHVLHLFGFLEQLFQLNEIFYVVEEILRESFYPGATYVFGKLDKYYVENENKTQLLEKALRSMLLSIASIPLGLQMLSNEPLVFEELIRGSIAPLRASWSAYDRVAFVANSGFLARGVDVLLELSPHVMSTLLLELANLFQDPLLFYDPWEHRHIRVFLHVLAIFSINTNCFVAFMTSENNCNKEDGQDDPTNLYEFFQHFMEIDSVYHQLGLMSLKTIIWNLDLYLYMLNLLNFQEKLLKYQEYSLMSQEEGADPEKAAVYVTDESSLLRHQILLNGYTVRLRRSEILSTPEEARLFSTLPPPQGCCIDDEPMIVAATKRVNRSDRIDENEEEEEDDNSELGLWLRDTGPGLRDEFWITQTRRAHKSSPNAMKHTVFLELLNQMEQAIPTVEWVDRFKWDPELSCDNEEFWLPEEKLALQLVLHYGHARGFVVESDDTEKNLKTFIRSTHDYINYNKSSIFEGFDWFLATIFLVCNADLERSKAFVNQILHFPSAMFLWPALAQVIDDNNEEEASTRLLFAHLLEYIVALEFPSVKFALKRECGVAWWMICDRLLTQFFWGILPWNEIIHFFAVCIMHPPDFILYYCVSLLNHCEADVIKSITEGKMWPEEMVLEDYRCHSQIGFMDRLSKRHGGKVLPSLTQRKFNFPEGIESKVRGDV
ncbi:hypothetical protein TKK_0018119 [Trichogramma kaykai]|uniref:Rab-GAP TBC domain-containing protein n=3 Tax=Trichogramma kaykai TaxID=54128 RepID=A0ABD2W0J9_9HYME